MNSKELYDIALKHPEINAFALACQSALETGNWQSELWLRAYNGAGIKAGSAWAGPVYDIYSPEQMLSGAMVQRRSSFRKYATPEAFVSDYAVKIKQNYQLCIQRKNNFIGYIDGLVSGPYCWATDKQYFGKVFSMCIKKAPEIFGDSASEKMSAALTYALEHNMLTPENAVTAKQIIGGGSGMKTVICLDAGHGGRDPGTSNGDVLEKDITLRFIHTLGALLSGYTVVYSRTDDSYVGLDERAKMANNLKAKLFVSVHCNGVDNTAANGIEIFTHTSQSVGSVKAAKAIYSHALKASGLRDRGVKSANYQVLRDTVMPAVLLELGFLSNDSDRKQLLSADWQQRVAVAVAAGIREVV